MYFYARKLKKEQQNNHIRKERFFYLFYLRYTNIFLPEIKLSDLLYKN